MAQFVDLISGTLSGVFDAIGKAETDQLNGQVKAAIKLSQGNDPMKVLTDLLAEGRPADLLIAAKGSIVAQLQALTKTDRTIGGGASGGIGGAAVPTLSIHVDYAQTNESSTGSNVTVQVDFERVDQTKSVDQMLDKLVAIKNALGLKDIPTPPPTPATPLKP